MCTFRVNHMMYGSWDIECDGQNFSLWWTIFCTFFKILKNWKKQLDISSFYTCVSKIIMITWCTVPEIRCAKDRWMNGQTNGQMDRQIGKWTDGRTDGQTDGWIEGRTYGKSEILRWVLHLKINIGTVMRNSDICSWSS